MKIYKKILNLGYGICCLLPFIVLGFVFFYCVKGAESGNGLFADLDTLVNNFSKDVFLKFDTNFVVCLEWFAPFKAFNYFISDMYWVGYPFSIVITQTPIFASLILYAEWVVLVSFFRLFGSVFGCMINFADRMLDKIGGTN